MLNNSNARPVDANLLCFSHTPRFPCAHKLGTHLVNANLLALVHIREVPEEVIEWGAEPLLRVKQGLECAYAACTKELTQDAKCHLNIWLVHVLVLQVLPLCILPTIALSPTSCGTPASP